MATIDILSARDWVELMISGVSVLGGFMAYSSGFEAWLAEARDAEAAEIGACVNEGLARGFGIGIRAALIAIAILAVS